MRTLLLILSLLIATPAVAEPCAMQNYFDITKEPDWECQAPGEDALVPRLQLAKPSAALKQDEKAPFTGILMEPDRVLQLGLRIKALRKLLWIEMQKGRDVLELEKSYILASAKAETGLVTSQRDSYKAQADQLRIELESERKWYKSWSFGLVLGIVVTAGSATALAVSLK